jgi:phage terminase large subunit GpA-like protein
MMEGLASVDDVIASAIRRLRPPPRLRMSEWADQFYYISAENSAEPGKWKCIPYQVGMLDAMGDPTVERVWVQKSARIGYTLMMGAVIGYHMHYDPCPILVIQPTIDDAKGYSKENIIPLIRDVPVLNEIMDSTFEEESDGRSNANTILHKAFPGGILSLAGANSGTGLRRVSRRVVNLDEVDAYPKSAGADGDPVKLGMKRAEYYWNRKLLGGSTPLIKDLSRIEELYEEGDQQKYYVPCPHCGHMDYLVFSKRDSGGHWLKFSKEFPEDAHFVCSKCDEAIEHKHKRSMIEKGQWRRTAPEKFTMSGRKIVSFHIWAAYSYSPNSTWADIAAEFLSAKDKPEELKTFVNTMLGETWEETGEAPDWEKLYKRRSLYKAGTVPEGVRFLTCGIDVQKDRVVYEVVGWGKNKQSWSIDIGVIEFDTSNQAEWSAVDELLTRTFPDANGNQHPIAKTAIDSGYNTTEVYAFQRRWRGRVISTKGQQKQRVVIESPRATDLKQNGKKKRRGAKVWNVGVDVVKAELYGWLRMERTDAPGYCWFPEYGEEYFKQLTAEQRKPVKNAKGFTVLEWHKLADRENHWLDARVYARAAASLLGFDTMQMAPVPQIPATEPTPAPKPEPVAETREPPKPALRPKTTPVSRLQIRRPIGKSWIRRR